MNNRKYLIIGLIGLIILTFGSGCISVQIHTPAPIPTIIETPAPIPTIIETPAPIPTIIETPVVTQKIADGFISIPAHSYYDYTFTVNSPTTIVGDFTAYGGGRNDIDVFIFDEMGFTNWINGAKNVPTYYSSGDVTVGNIDASLVTPGKYYLVYNNGCLFCAKSVKTNVNALS